MRPISPFDAATFRLKTLKSSFFYETTFSLVATMDLDDDFNGDLNHSNGIPSLPPTGDTNNDDARRPLIIARGAEPSPPKTRLFNCECVYSTVKFGVPFIVVVIIGSLLHWILDTQLDWEAFDIFGTLSPFLHDHVYTHSL